MDLADILAPDAVIPALQGTDKKQIVTALSDIAARRITIKPRDVFTAVWAREELGSTGLGRGVAVPHGRLAGLDRMVCVFARLAHPVDYDSLDGEPVDLVFLLLGPEQGGADHLKALARIARVMREPETAARLRGTRDRAVLYALLTEPTRAAPLSRTG